MKMMAVTVTNAVHIIALLFVVMVTVKVMKLKLVQKIVKLQKPVQTVNLTLQRTALNAVILPGMNTVITVLILNPVLTGIAQDVPVQVMHLLYVVTVPVLVTKIVKPAKLTVAYAANVLRVR